MQPTRDGALQDVKPRPHPFSNPTVTNASATSTCVVQPQGASSSVSPFDTRPILSVSRVVNRIGVGEASILGTAWQIHRMLLIHRLAQHCARPSVGAITNSRPRTFTVDRTTPLPCSIHFRYPHLACAIATVHFLWQAVYLTGRTVLGPLQTRKMHSTAETEMVTNIGARGN
jgi:hypothetical protein